jgi:hypothetical protein
MTGVGLDVSIEDGENESCHDESACQHKDPHGLAYVALDAAVEEVAVAHGLVEGEVTAYDSGSQLNQGAARVDHGQAECHTVWSTTSIPAATHTVPTCHSQRKLNKNLYKRFLFLYLF